MGCCMESEDGETAVTETTSRLIALAPIGVSAGIAYLVANISR